MSQAHRQRSEALLATRIQDRTAKCAVIGLGLIGSSLAQALLHRGYRVCGFDLSNDALRQCDDTIDESCRASWSSSSTSRILEGCEVVAIAVRLQPDDDGVVSTQTLDGRGKEHTKMDSRHVPGVTCHDGSSRNNASTSGKMPLRIV